MNTALFRSRLLPGGHLYCPKEFAEKKNVLFKVIAIFDDTDSDPSNGDIELAAIHDNSTDFLCEEEIQHYMSLEEL